MRLQFLSGALASVVLAGCALPEDPELFKDVQTVCERVPESYAYFETRAPYWDEACAQRLAELGTNPTGLDVLASLEKLIDDLYEPHMSLDTNSATSPHLVPSGSDLWFERAGEDYVLRAIRPASGAAATELAIGDRLVSFNGLGPEELMLTRMHAGRDHMPEARKSWALNAALAGYRGGAREIEVSRGGDVLSYTLGDAAPAEDAASLRYRIFTGNIGYVRLHNSLDDPATEDAFKGILDALLKTDGLILDLRDTPGGGGTDVAEPIMGHFIDQRQGYQITVPKGRAPSLREIDPAAHHI